MTTQRARDRLARHIDAEDEGQALVQNTKRRICELQDAEGYNPTGADADSFEKRTGPGCKRSSTRLAGAFQKDVQLIDMLTIQAFVLHNADWATHTQFQSVPAPAAIRARQRHHRRARTWDPMIKRQLARAAVVIKPVFADSLRKTGIFADVAGDFRKLVPKSYLGVRRQNRTREDPAFPAHSRVS
jgi:hypothetical protein